jgi:hypothetical protein
MVRYHAFECHHRHRLASNVYVYSKSFIFKLSCLLFAIVLLSVFIYNVLLIILIVYYSSFEVIYSIHTVMYVCKKYRRMIEFGHICNIAYPEPDAGDQIFYNIMNFILGGEAF